MVSCGVSALIPLHNHLHRGGYVFVLYEYLGYLDSVHLDSFHNLWALSLPVRHRNHTVVNSKVIAVTVRPEPKGTETQLEIELAHLANVSTPNLTHSPTRHVEDNITIVELTIEYLC